ncbi:LysR family transcriptional regulator [Sphingomonas sp. M1-B02]|uniref:LysR family transcriptional regulator n=1 Tax=Sphingomonas sp. M1-B02 TaxID=3114300 RepID=UPI0022404C0D|nr:LysR family transcriptional regulator [Sphingomonas sp. S6-11]UZK65429.1 LysR family transcriptional regulator [Sphingomonas sp. S6-11]
MLRIRSEGRHAIRDWNDIRFVLAVAATGSFHGAAKVTEAHETTVARRVQRLETELGAKLFVRQSHGMLLTTAGKALVEKAREIEQAAISLQQNIAGMDTRLVGVVRISVPEGIGAYWLTPVLADFQLRHPDIRVEVFTGILPVGLGKDEVDVSLTITRPTDDRLAILRAGEVRYGLFSSPGYLADYGEPRTAADLASHRLCHLSVYDTDPQLKWWTDITRAAEHVPFFSNSTSLYVVAIRAGIGIGMLANFYRREMPELVALSIVPRCKTSLWLVSHRETNKGAKVRTLIEFLKEGLADARGTWLI